MAAERPFWVQRLSMSTRIPPVVPPPHRRRPLPTPCADEPQASERLQRILASPSYRRADLDLEFLDRDEARPSRLALEYQKPELLLREAGVRATIVVFGGTRLVEPAVAARTLALAQQTQAAHPDDPAAAAQVRIAERVAAKSRYYDEARQLGRIIGQSGAGPLDCRLVVVTGGGAGAMEAANRGAFDVGAKSVGLNITLPHEQFPNPYVTPELCFQFRYFALRKLHFMLRARALVAFPGGYGTLDELFETLTLVQTRTIAPLPIVLVGEDFWRRTFDAEMLAAEGMIDPEDVELFCFAETAEEVWTAIGTWYETAGESVCG
jgi:hypothetical protein